jgi:NAD-reducing hydrogenase small subunit
MAKVKVATDWLAGCAGCHMSLLDIDERILDLLNAVEITASPITDLKRPRGVDVGILEGAVANTSNRAVAEEMREEAKTLIALGDCACFGGIVAMRNPLELEEAMKRAYVESETTKDGRIPSSDEIATILDKAVGVDQVVKVDYYIPGCPPSADTIFFALSELLAGRAPALSGDNLRYD